MISQRRRQALAAVGALAVDGAFAARGACATAGLFDAGEAIAASGFDASSIAAAAVHEKSEHAIQLQQLHGVDEALRVPAIAGLFDQRSSAIVQCDRADFEAMVSPIRAHADSTLWTISVDLHADASRLNDYARSLQHALDAVCSHLAPQQELVNVLTVFSCNSNVPVVSLLRQYQTLLADSLSATGVYGLGVVADERAATPRMTMLCVTQPIT